MKMGVKYIIPVKIQREYDWFSEEVRNVAD